MFGPSRTSSITSSSDNAVHNIANPYYIYPNENPTLVLVSLVLFGGNYHSWAHAMKMALMSKNKLKFIDGSIMAPPITDPMFLAWERCNTLVISWLNRALSPTIAQSILWIDKGYDVWSDLHDHFYQGDVFRIVDLQEELFSLRQGNYSISDYFTRLKILWDELLNLRPILRCSCDPRCSCGASDVVRLYMEQDYTIRFLKGLSDRFSGVKSHIMLLEPVPSVNKVFSLVQQEREMGISSLPFESKALISKAAYRGPIQGAVMNKFTEGAPVKQCTYCGKPKHTIETCYKKYGFSPGYKFRNQPSASLNFSLTVEQQPKDSDSKDSMASSHHLSLTPDQYQKLLSLIQDNSSKPSSSHFVNHVSTRGITSKTPSHDWIVDIGATDHVCFSLSFFSSYHKIKGKWQFGTK